MKVITLSLLLLSSVLRAAPVSGTVTYEGGTLLSDQEWNELISTSQLAGGPLGSAPQPALVTGDRIATWTYAGQEVSIYDTRQEVIDFLENVKVGQGFLGIEVSWENIMVVGDSTPVVFPDPALEEAILDALGMDAGPVTEGDMRNLGQLRLRGTQVTNLTGLEKAVTLEILDLSGSQVPDNDVNLDVIRALEIYCLYVNGGQRWVTVFTGDLSAELYDQQGVRIVGSFDTSAITFFDAGLLPLDLGNAENQSFLTQLEGLGIDVETTVESFFYRVIFSGLEGLDVLPTADPNGDGVPNLVAHALGLPLNVTLDSESLRRLPAALISESTSQAGVCFILPEDAPDDVIYVVEHREGLGEGGWSEIARKSGELPWDGSARVVETPNGDETVTIKAYHAGSIQGARSGFLRLRVLLSEE